MLEFTVENRYSERIVISEDPAYAIQEIDGIDPPDAVLNLTKNAGMDGSVYNSAYLDNRTITITLAINSPAEDNRLKLYRFFQSKKSVRLLFKTDLREVYIDGYVQSVQISYFEKKEVAQITVMCPDPMFKQAEAITATMAPVEALFEFPFSIDSEGIPFSEASGVTEVVIANPSEVEVGMDVTVRILNEMSSILIKNKTTEEMLKLEYDFLPNDIVQICTISKKKRIEVLRGATTSNIIGARTENSDWPVVGSGSNVIEIEGGLLYEVDATVTIHPEYEGV